MKGLVKIYKMTIYLDIVLLENIILNYIIILSTAIISKSKINTIKMLLSSCFGSIYAILNYMIEINIGLSIIIKVLISICMITTAFKEYRIKIIMKQLMFFYLVSFTFGGIAFMLLFFIKPQNVIINEMHLVGTYPIKIAILAGGVGFIIITIVAEMIKFRINKKVIIYELEIFYNGKNKLIKTMLDTGNLLKDPITNLDVVIVEKESLNAIVEEDILDNISNIINGKWIESPNIHNYKIKVIPFSSLGNNNGLLIGFKPDYIKIYSEEVYVRNDILIGIYDGKLSRNNMYTSLIGLEVMKCQNKNVINV